MALKSIAKSFANLSNYQKALIFAGAGGAGSYIVYKGFFSPYKCPGLPDAKDLNGFAPTMTRNEAQQILNLSGSYTYGKTDIQRQHRILMSLHHPDKGGSSYIATKINEARDFLTLGAKD